MPCTSSTIKVPGLFLVIASLSLPADEPMWESPLLLTNVAQVRSLNATQSIAAIPVRLQGVVLAEADPPGRALIIADQTAGIYVLANQNFPTPYHRSDLLEIEGVTDPGQFAPIIRVSAARKLGTATNPAPRVVSYQQLITGALDAQWVEIAGVVRRYLSPATNSDVWRILLAADGGVVPIRSRSPRDTQIQEDAEIRVQAICLYQFNQKRQVLTPVLQLVDQTGIRVEKPAAAHPFDAPVRLANSLLQFTPDTPSGHRVHVRGVVTHAQSGSLVWIRDESSGLRIQTPQMEELQAGDEIDVLGFPTYGSFSPVLEDAIFKKNGSGQSPAPLTITTANAAFDHEDDLIATAAVLTEIQPVFDGLAFTFDQGGTSFKGILKLPAGWKNSHPDWQPMSRVRVAGICSVLHDDVRPLTGVWQPQSFQILLRSPADLTTITQPPWWNPKRITYVLAVAFSGLLLATGVVVFLTRRRLNEQAHRRAMAEAEFTAILAERNRVAREIHDTLAQGLAATSVQLRLAKKQVEGDTKSLHHHLDAAQQLVRDSLEEARNSIWNMRSQVLETGDLASALSNILKQMADGSDLRTGFEVTGRVRRFAPVIENNLLRIGQEAITNAIKHAQAREIKVALDFGEKQFHLTVWDNGQGFDPTKPPLSAGGFGLVGMRERVAELKGELNVRSAPGDGAEVSLVVPLSGE